MVSVISDAPVAARTRSRKARARLVLAAGVVALAVPLAACGSSGSTNSSSSTAPTASTSASTPSGSDSVSGKKVTIVGVADSNPWAAVYNSTIKQYLSSKGADVKVSASSDPAAQVQLLNSAVAEKPDLIFLEALDSKAMAPAIAKAKAAGVKIVNTDGPADPSVADGLNQVLSDNVSLGQFAAQNLVDGLQEEGKKEGNIAVITGTKAMLVTQDRMKGFHAVMAKYPQYKVVAEEDGAWDPVKSGQIASQLFAKYGKDGLQAMYGMADYMAVPIITAAKQSGITVGVKNNGLIVTGGNCFKIGIDAIRAGEMYGTATEDPGTISLQAAKYGEQILLGKDVELTQTVKEERVTPKTLDTYAEQCSKA
jgi:ABC-type sugar transport system substrate-binding protein